MQTRRRLSEAISEGEAISTSFASTELPRLRPRRPPERKELRPTGVVHDVRAATVLPILVAGGSPQEAGGSGADAWLLVAETEGDELEQRDAAARDLGLECVVDVHDEEELEAVLARIDPEIVLLSPRAAEDEDDAVDRILELLPDVPAGKLVAAELDFVTEDGADRPRAGGRGRRARVSRID